MAFPVPTQAQMRQWHQNYFYSQFLALEAIYDATLANAPTAGAATEATLAAFKTENNDNLIDVVAALLQIENNTDGIEGLLATVGGQTVTYWCQQIYNLTEALSLSSKGQASYSAVGDTPQLASTALAALIPNNGTFQKRWGFAVVYDSVQLKWVAMAQVLQF